MRPGTRNSPDGRYTIADPTLPHQIILRIPGASHRKTYIQVDCNCGELHAFVKQGTDSLAEAWRIYDEHLDG